MKKTTAFFLTVFLTSSLPSLLFSAEEKKEKAGSIFEDLFLFPSDAVRDTGSAFGETFFNLGEIRVSSSRLSSSLSDKPAVDLPHNVTFIGSSEIQESPGESVPELLGGKEGVTFSDDLGQGLGARVDLRGFGGEGKQALVLFDGLRAVEPFDNSVTWSLYPRQYLEWIEVQRGGGSTAYGEGALSGAIRMKTKGPTPEKKITLESTLGDFNTRTHFFDAGGTVNNFGVYAGGHYATTSGYRQNGDHEGTGTLMKASYRFSDLLHAENAFYFADNETGIPGPLTLQEMETDRRQKDPDGQFGDQFRDKLVQNGLSASWLIEPLNVELSNLLGYRMRVQDSQQSFGGAFPGRSLNEIETETFSDIIQATWVVEKDTYKNDVTVGLEWSKDDIYNPFMFEDFTFGPFSSERAIDRRMIGVFAQNHAVYRDRLTLEPGVRWDRIDWDIYDLKSPQLQKSKTADSVSPKFGVEYKITPVLAAYGSYAGSFKVPDANTLIFETPNIFRPNPEIDPQIARHHEAGVRYAHPVFGSVRAAAFYIETKKEILFNDITNTNENFDTMRSGLELANEVALSSSVRVFSSYTFTAAEFDNGAFDGKTVPLVPKSKWTAGVRVEPVKCWTVSAEAAGVYDQYALNDFNNIFPMEDYWTLGGRISYKQKNWEAFFAVQNLLGEEYSSFVTSNGVDTLNFNPAPTAYIEVGVKIEL